MSAVVTQIENAMKAGIDALALPGCTSFIRKIPALPSGKHPIEATISIGAEGDTIYMDFEQSTLINYPGAVTLVTADGSKLEDDATLRLWREQIRQKLDDPATYSTVTTFFNLASGGGLPYDPTNLKADFNWTVMTFTIQSHEMRTA